MKLLCKSCRVSTLFYLIVPLLICIASPPHHAAAQNSKSLEAENIKVLSINLLFSEIDDRNERLKIIADYVAENYIDFVLLQEVVCGDLVKTDNSAFDLRDFIFERHNINYYARTETDKILSNWLRVGNGILSLYEIEASNSKQLPKASEFEIFDIYKLELKRNVMMLRLNITGFGAIHIYNTHLCAGCEIEEREEQLDALLQFVKEIESNTPGDNPVIVGGDFNIDRIKKSGEENFLYEKVLNEDFVDAYDAAAVDPLDSLCDDETFPDEHCTIGVSNLGDSSAGRIDYIFTKGFGRVNESKVIFNTAITGDSTVSDHSAVFVNLDLPSQEIKAPVPDIKVNGSDSPLFVTIGEPVSSEVALDAGDYSGVSADYWVLAMAPTGEWYYFEYPVLQWHYAGSLDKVSTAYQGALNDFAPLEIYTLDTSNLSEGKYIFYFAVDTILNGTIDYDDVQYDWVTVNLTP